MLKFWKRKEISNKTLQELQKYTILRVGGKNVYKKDVEDLYESYLVRAGHCPICDDYLFVDMELVDHQYYKVEKRCINHKCDYSEDISQEFNEHLNIPYGNPIDDDILDGGSDVVVDCTGHLSYHYWGLGLDRDAFGKKEDLTNYLGYVEEGGGGACQEELNVVEDLEKNKIRVYFVSSLVNIVVAIVVTFFYLFIGL